MNEVKDIDRLLHITEAIDMLERHLAGVSLDDFYRNELLVNLAARQISIIGEAMNNLSDELKQKYPDLPYAEARQMRNFLIHEYFDTNSRTLWETYTDDILPLKEKIPKIQKDLNS